MDKLKQIPKLRAFFSKILPDLEPDLVDWVAEVDSSLTYSENKKHLIDMLGASFEAIESSKSLEEKAEIEGNQLAVENADKEFNEAVDNIVSQHSVEVSDYYRHCSDYVNMVAEGYSNSLILVSEGGLGKTHLVLKNLKKSDTPFSYRSGYSTALSMYEDLWQLQNSDNEVVFYDDMDNFFSDKRAIALLKPLLWEVGEKRIVSYMTTSKLLKAPARFEFTKKIIFAVNELPSDSASLRALTNRALTYELHFSWVDKIKLFFAVARQPDSKKKLSESERLEVAEYLKQTTSEATDNLSLRSLLQAFNFYSYSKDNWKSLLIDVLPVNEHLAFIIKHETQTTAKQVLAFYTTFGLSRATYYRYKKLLATRRGL